MSQGAAAAALAAAILFGAATPIAKRLTGSVEPWLLAGLLYLGSGIGLSLVLGVRRMLGAQRVEAPLRRADVPWLAGAIVAGGIVAPVLLVHGLAHGGAAGASLLLNLEAALTALLAWAFFHEAVGQRVAVGIATVTAGGVVLAWPAEGVGFSVWSLAVPGACLAWALDNNLTRRISSGDPLRIAALKGLAAGGTNLAIALARGAELPSVGGALAACAVGFAGYGVSLTLFVRALRHLGATRTMGYFGVGPFVGAALSIFLFEEPLTATLAVGGGLVALGAALQLTERHEHEHTHDALTHDHRHVHDAHHQHEHPPGMAEGEEHSHPHTHEPLSHRHRHHPDLHHRHGH